MTVPAYFKQAVEDYNNASSPVYPEKLKLMEEKLNAEISLFNAEQKAARHGKGITVERIHLNSYDADYKRRELVGSALTRILRPFHYKLPVGVREIARLKGWALELAAVCPYSANKVEVQASAFVPGEGTALAHFNVKASFFLPKGRIEDTDALWDLVSREQKKIRARLALLVDMLPPVGGNELVLKGEF